MASSESLARVQTIYIAYYGRPADPGGLEFWADQLDQNNGDLNQVIDSFGNSEEFDDNFGQLSDEQLITNLYQQMFNRPPDPGGLEFFTDRLSSGEASLASIAVQIADGADGIDVFTLSNKNIVADAFTDSVESDGVFYGAAQLSVVKNILATVTSDGVTGVSADALYEPLIASFPVAVNVPEQQSVETQYLAILFRAATPEELDEWVAAVVQDPAAVQTLSAEQLASVEYTGGSDPEDQIDLVFENLFGRSADSGALQFYSGRLDDGESLGALIVEISNAAIDNDRRTLDNRLSVAIDMSTSQAAIVGIDAARLQDLYADILPTVEDDGDSLIRAVILVDDAVASGDTGDQISNSTSTSRSIAIDGEGFGSLAAERDHDWFRVDLEADRIFTVSVVGSSSVEPEFPGLNTLTLALYDDAGNWLGLWQSDDRQSPGAVLQIQPEQTGSFYVAIEGGSNWTGSYTVSVDALTPPDDFSADTSTSGELSLNQTTAGLISITGDADWFVVELEQDRDYTIILQGEGDRSHSGNTLALVIYDASGNPIALSDVGTGTNPGASVQFTPDASATFYVAAEGVGAWTGSYDINLFDNTPGADDFAGNVSTTGLLSTSTPSLGEIEVEQDADWFAISLDPDFDYTFDLSASDSNDGSLENSTLRLLNSTGGEVVSDNGSGSNSRIEFTPTTNGEFFLAVEGGSQSDTGTYTLSATAVAAEPEPEPEEIPGNNTTTVELAAGTQLQSSIEVEFDADWFRIELVEGRRYLFDQRGAGTGNGTLKDPNLQVRSENGISRALNDDDGSGLNAQIVYTAATTGTHFIDAGGKGGDSTGTYTLSFFDLDSDIPGNTSTVVSLAVDGAVVDSALSTQNDSDWFEVFLLEETNYQFTLFTDATLTAGMRLYNSSGVEINIGNQAGATQIGFEPGVTGKYFVSADAEAGSGTYNISVANVTSDILGGPGTPEVITFGEQVRSDINEPNDSDWFRIELNAGDQYIFEALGKITGDGTLADPTLSLFKYVNNQQVSEDTSSNAGTGANERLVITANESSSSTVSYFLAVGGTAPGDYLLTALNAGPEIPEGQGGAVALAQGESVFSYIGVPFDEDWFRVSLSAGTTYRFDMKGRVTDDGSLLDPKLILYDSGGVSREIDDDGGIASNASLLFTPSSSGDYFISAIASDGQDIGTYTLSFNLASQASQSIEAGILIG